MSKEYVDVTEEYAQREIESVKDKIKNPNPHVGVEEFSDGKSSLEKYIRHDDLADFTIDTVKWNPKEIEGEKVGFAMEIDPSDKTSHNYVTEGYVISAMSIDDVWKRIVYIMKDKDIEDGLIYFHIITPEQKKPTTTHLNMYLDRNWRILAEWEEAKRTGKISKGLYER